MMVQLQVQLMVQLLVQLQVQLLVQLQVPTVQQRDWDELKNKRKSHKLKLSF